MAAVVVPPCRTGPQHIETTTNLYELIEAIQEVVGPENDDLVVAIVMDLVRSGRIKFLRHRGVSHCN